MKRFLLIIGSVFALLMPTRAYADIIFTPFAGVTFGGDAPSSKFNWGGNVTLMGAVVGIELDFGYSPNFFNQDTGTAVISDSNVVTLMGNLIVGVGRGPFRPYVSGGLGLLRSDVEAGTLFDTNSVNDFGFNVGGGVFMFFTKHFGIRGDIRYFRSLLDPSDDNDLDVFLGSIDFWRGVGGVSFKF
jgi:opacity protein-like surface antigen